MSDAEPDGPPRRALLVRLVPLVVVAALAAVVVALAFTLGRRSAGDSSAPTTATLPADTIDPSATTTFLLTVDGANADLLADVTAAVPVVMNGIYGISGVVATAESDGVRVELPIASRGAVLTDLSTQFANLGVRAVRGSLGIEDQQLLKSIPGAYVCTAEAGTVPPAGVALYSPLCIAGHPTLALDVLPEVLERPMFTTAATADGLAGWTVSVTLAPGAAGADAWYALDEQCAATTRDPAAASDDCPGGSLAVLFGRFVLGRVDPVAGATPGGVIPLDLLDGGTLDEATATAYAAAIRVAIAAPKFTVSPA